MCHTCSNYLMLTIRSLFLSDMEWLNAPKDVNNMEVDIGYMPKMELKSTGASVLAFDRGQDRRDRKIESAGIDHEQAIQSIRWTEEITQEEARRKLEVAMYPFKEVMICNKNIHLD